MNIDINREEEKAQFIVEVIQKFPEPYLTIAIYKIRYGYSYEQITKDIGLSMRQVRTAFYRIKDTLKKLWNVHEEMKTKPEKIKEFNTIIEELDKKVAKRNRNIEKQNRKEVIRINNIVGLD